MSTGEATRRQFLQFAGCLPLLGAGRVQEARFAYQGSESSIRVFSISGQHWSCIQTLPSRRPVSLTRDSEGKTLYVANQIDEHDGLPRGTVEAFRIDADTGHLSLLSCTPLSLSATRPHCLALAPAGDYLVVAAFTGGTLNVLPVGTDGSLSRPVHIIKEVGCGEHPERQASSHPHTIAFDPTGRHLLVSDFGCDRLSIFALESGRLRLCSRVSVKPGDGPGPIEFHASLPEVTVINLLSASLSTYSYCAETGEVGKELKRRPLESVPEYSRSSRQTIAVRLDRSVPAGRDPA
jgi:6-phosphogluconolactonase